MKVVFCLFFVISFALTVGDSEGPCSVQSFDEGNADVGLSGLCGSCMRNTITVPGGQVFIERACNPNVIQSGCVDQTSPDGMVGSFCTCNVEHCNGEPFDLSDPTVAAPGIDCYICGPDNNEEGGPCSADPFVPSALGVNVVRCQGSCITARAELSGIAMVQRMCTNAFYEESCVYGDADGVQQSQCLCNSNRCNAVTTSVTPPGGPDETTVHPTGPSEIPDDITEVPTAPSEIPEDSTVRPTAPSNKPEDSTIVPTAPPSYIPEATIVPTAPSDVPEASTVVPTVPSVAPGGSTVVPTAPSVVPEASTVVPTVSSVAIDGSIVVPTVPSVAPSDSTVVPTAPSVVPEASTVVPTVPSVAPDGSTIVPTVPSDVPEGSTVVPTVSSVALNESTIVPTAPSVVPEESTIVLTSSSNVPEDSTIVPTASINPEVTVAIPTIPLGVTESSNGTSAQPVVSTTALISEEPPKSGVGSRHSVTSFVLSAALFTICLIVPF
ncbi:hypothetical protein BV898_03315 [Hypsibius exemplaris]|uniref:Uncharacterized protein n=1 Tax=Hypsibius exemplaris TaxID=2072580 RepID=A0A1W0X5W8_HYPEX|nr:hypothetical protein BV898_03315 [Hypsibius exemplaris]